MTSGVARGPAERFQALCALAQEMSLVETEEKIHRVVLKAAGRVLDLSNCAVLLLDDESRELTLVAEHGYAPEARGLRLPIDGERGISAAVAAKGEPVYVPDVREDERYVPGVPEARSELAVPIQMRDRTIGVLNVESEQVAAFDEDDALLLQALASLLAIALELNRARGELDRLSITDPLTGAYNRRYLERMLAGEKERAERFSRPIGLLLLDLDDFKRVNDRYGHSIGDRVLVEFAAALESTVRKIDAVIRFGGDEFLVVLLETDAQGVVVASRRAREKVVARLNESGIVDEPLGVSVGVAVRWPGEDLDEKIAEADRDLYADKDREETPG